MYKCRKILFIFKAYGGFIMKISIKTLVFLLIFPVFAQASSTNEGFFSQPWHYISEPFLSMAEFCKNKCDSLKNKLTDTGKALPSYIGKVLNHYKIPLITTAVVGAGIFSALRYCRWNVNVSVPLSGLGACGALVGERYINARLWLRSLENRYQKIKKEILNYDKAFPNGVPKISKQDLLNHKNFDQHAYRALKTVLNPSSDEQFLTRLNSMMQDLSILNEELEKSVGGLTGDNLRSLTINLTGLSFKTAPMLLEECHIWLWINHKEQYEQLISNAFYEQRSWLHMPQFCVKQIQSLYIKIYLAQRWIGYLQTALQQV